MADEPNPQEQTPSLADLAKGLGHLAQVQEATNRTLAQLAQQRAAPASQPQPQPRVDPSEYERANEQYLKALASDPLGTRRAENQALANELLGMVRQELQQTIGETEKRRRAEEMERSIYQQNPDLVSEGPYIEFYLTHLNQNPATQGWQIGDKIAQALNWARENKAEREKQIITEHERAQRQIARASTPGGGSFRDPGQGDVETGESQEEANKKRFEVLQGKKAAAMGGGRYVK